MSVAGMWVTVHCHPFARLLVKCPPSQNALSFNPLNEELNPICHLLALLEAHQILHVSGLRVNDIIIFFDSGLHVQMSMHIASGCEESFTGLDIHMRSKHQQIQHSRNKMSFPFPIHNQRNIVREKHACPFEGRNQRT